MEEKPNIFCGFRHTCNVETRLQMRKVMWTVLGRKV